ncbi:MAG: matrixin family metalloprotease [Pseudomonadota bacterium]
MATKKKTAAEPAKAAAPAPVRICFERIIPDELDPERMVRRQMRQQMVDAAGGARRLKAEGVAHVARMAVVNSKKWPLGSTLRCRFLDGSAKMRNTVTRIAKEWERHADIKLKFVSKGPAEIRISFYADEGSWSAVGRDALNTAYFPLHQPTMNFGWLRDDTDKEEAHRVVTHEFGHALGCIHEHQSPKFTRKWNTAAVMKYFQGPPNFWTPEDIRANVLEKYSPKGLSATRFDPKSIMLYSFDAALFSDGLGDTNENTDLSSLDKTMIAKMYPKKA